jgi:hypothetical protein
MKRAPKILATFLLVTQGLVFAEVGAESHRGGVLPNQRPEAMVPEALAPQRLSELINACVLGRPAPPAPVGTAAPLPPAIQNPTVPTDLAQETKPPAKESQKPSGESPSKPPAAGPDPKVAALRTLLAKCSTCHSANVTAGSELASISLSFGSSDDHAPGPKTAAQIASSFAPGGKMASQLSLSAAEKQLLAAWAAASK